jgi:hypothetical protein
MRIEYTGGRRARLGVDGHATCMAERYASRQEHGEPCQNIRRRTGPRRGRAARKTALRAGCARAARWARPRRAPRACCTRGRLKGN